MEKLIGIILMAGLSTRFKGEKNKQLCLLNNKPVFSYSIDAFSKSKIIKNLIIVVNENNKQEIEKYLKDNNIQAKLVIGGSSRQESVENALQSTSLNDNDIVLIHDGARPLVDDKIITDVAETAKTFGASTTYLKATDTIAIKNENDEIANFIKRDLVAQIQTPQGFKYSLLKEAHQTKNKDATDDCSLVLKLGHNVKLVEGNKKLHKITTQEDIQYLEGLLK